MSLNYIRIITGDLQENCYITWQDGSNECIVFDPGWDAPVLREEIVCRKLTVAAFLLTHCHVDHIGALSALKSSFPSAPIYCPEAEVEWLAKPRLNLSFLFGCAITAPPPDKIIRPDDTTLSIAGQTFACLHVPGHSPGSTAYYIAAEGKDPGLVICGDTLFAGSIGRTNFPGGTSEADLIANIREKLFTLPDPTRVLPGHGEATWIGDEKENNPLFQ